MKNNNYQIVSEAEFNNILEQGQYKLLTRLSEDGDKVYVNNIGSFIVERNVNWKDPEEGYVRFYYVCTLYTKSTVNSGYKMIGIKGKLYTVHSLVAEAFYGPCPEGCVIDHINGKKDDNNFENLQYVSRKENQKRYVESDRYNPHNTYKGRYYIKTGIFHKPDGSTEKMTPEEYIEYLKSTRPMLAAAPAIRAIKKTLRAMGKEGII